MKRGSRPSPKKKSSSRRGRSTNREHTILIVLLAAIAVLLGVLVALLPDVPRPAEGGLADGRPEASDEDGGDAVDRVGPQPLPGDGAGEGPVTEAYPPGEDPDARAPAGGESADGEMPDDAATGDEHWWLPDSPPPPEERGALVLVLDDAGNTLDGLEAFLDLPVPFAVAVLPQLEYSVRAAAMAAASGKEILLHLPMEAESGADPGPGAILTGLPPEEIASRVSDDLASVPGAIGVNNHMGSKATADSAVMRAVLGALHERELFFLDSRTTAATTGRAVAAEVGIPFAERAVFLDHERTREAILRSLGHALEVSGEGEPMVMIGHVTVPLLAEILSEAHPVIIDAGYEFAPLSSLVTPFRVAAEGAAAAGDAE